MAEKFIIPAKEGGAKSLKALNHERHEGHKGKEKLFFVFFVSLWFPSFTGLVRHPPRELLLLPNLSGSIPSLTSC